MKVPHDRPFLEPTLAAQFKFPGGPKSEVLSGAVTIFGTKSPE